MCVYVCVCVCVCAGFRKYESIRMTLCHELTHNVWGDHDNNFKALCSQLNREVDEVCACAQLKEKRGCQNTARIGWCKAHMHALRKLSCVDEWYFNHLVVSLSGVLVSCVLVSLCPRYELATHGAPVHQLAVCPVCLCLVCLRRCTRG